MLSIFLSWLYKILCERWKKVLKWTSVRALLTKGFDWLLNCLCSLTHNYNRCFPLKELQLLQISRVLCNCYCFLVKVYNMRRSTYHIKWLQWLSPGYQRGSVAPLPISAEITEVPYLGLTRWVKIIHWKKPQKLTLIPSSFH